MISQRILGTAVLALGLFVYFYLIPVGIVTPSNVKVLALSPDFWPKIVAVLFGIMGLLMMVHPGGKENKEEDEMSFSQWLQRIPRLIIFLCGLFGFYFAMPTFGMVVPSIVLIFLSMLFAGDRNWIRMVVLSLLVPTLLYCFFVFVAQIPIPLGVFEFIRG